MRSFCCRQPNEVHPVASAPPAFKVEVQPHRERVHVLPCGELDLATVGEVRAQLDQLRAVGWRNIVMDLRNVSFIDSTGLGLLVEAQQHAEANGIDFAVIECSEAVRRVLAVTGLSDWLHTSATGPSQTVLGPDQSEKAV
jgi:anti-anti-sigma factor